MIENHPYRKNKNLTVWTTGSYRILGEDLIKILIAHLGNTPEDQEAKLRLILRHCAKDEEGFSFNEFRA
jgi:hypothetical protein